MREKSIQACLRPASSRVSVRTGIKRDAERTARDQGGKQVGYIVRDEKDIALNRLELAVEQNLAQQAQDFINAEKERNDQGGTGDG